MDLSPLQTLAVSRGISLEDILKEALVAGDSESRASKYEEVREGPELARILALPRRPPPAGTEETRKMAEVLTAKLARVPNPKPGPLYPVQAAGLHAIWERKGAYCPVPVAGGKTLLGYLSFQMMGAKRPLYILPASLEKGTRRAFQAYAKDWHGPRPDAIRTLSFQMLSRAVRPGEPERLDVLNPDMIVVDEAQYLKNKQASCTKKFRRYVEKNPNVILVFLTGTGMRRSVKDFHYAQWALKEYTPFPRSYTELETWADHTDVKAPMGPRAKVGALVQLYNAAEKAELAATSDEEEIRDISRGAIGRRIMETPGVVCGCEGPLNIPLSVDAAFPEREDPKIGEFFQNVRAKWELPSGELIVDGKDLARHATCMALGYWLRWDPAPPEHWKTARSEWGSFARKVILHNRRGIDSEKAVKDAVKSGLLKDYGLLDNWIRERDALRKETGHLFPPSIETVYSEEPIEYAARWADEHKGIVWCKNTSFGKRVAKALGCPYYGELGVDPVSRRFVEDHPHGEPMVVSYMANREGKNLQFGWSANLWLGCAPDEQALGRVHRPGQEAEIVTNTVFFGAREHVAAYWTQVSIAETTQRTKQQPQRLCFARTDVPRLEEVEKRGGPRWVK